MVSEFFCLSCSRTVYSHPDETCPVCSSPLLEIRGVMREPEVNEIALVLNDIETPDPEGDGSPAEPAVADGPHD